VRGQRNGIATRPRVRFFDMGDRKWRSAPSWSAASGGLTHLYLSAAKSGSAVGSLNDGTLASSVPTGRDSYQDAYVYDPAGGASVPAGKDGPDGFLPYADLDQRLDNPNGLVFTTPVLKQPLRLAGPSEFRFWAVTEASDMAWTVRLADVAPDGSARLITQGWLRGSFRAVDASRSRDGSPYLPDDHDTPVTIGETIQYRMDIWDTAYTLAPGHRLRMWLGSSDTPTHEPLPVAGRNLLFHDATHPSQLMLGTATDSLAMPMPSMPVCKWRRDFAVRVPSSWRHAKAYVGGKRARITRRGGRRVVVVHTKGRGRSVLVRITGVDRRGRHVTTKHRYSLCR
jgi:putative CocE/NonD family hydrolase